MWLHSKPILVTFGNRDNDIYAFFDVVEAAGKRLTNTYTECRHGMTRAIDRIGKVYSFDVLRVKLLLASMKQEIVTGYRSVWRRKPEPPMPEMVMARSFMMLHTEQYEEVSVPERRQVTWGVDLSRRADWLEEERTGQRRLAL